MKRSQLIAGATAMAVLATAFGAASVAEAKPGKGGHRGHGPEMTFEQLDANGDGKITAEDLAAAKAARFAEADTNGDGALSAEELQAQADARRADRVEKMIERMDANGDGVLSMEEMEAGRGDRGDRGDRGGRMISRMDTDGDGAVSAEEFEAAKAKMAERRGGKRHGEADTRSE
ncbi:EF hand [Pseudoruegeria aquimaris]|uniref:EF hand n=1 Tax=Pseudoruegeria aquimaris TaxID=393663 RepID=A0A1Y5T9E3_9RHOB|nr:EF-hand domain-containing protein [Pseudoruegeria aquimaris]SLN56855.1 EF hand [Pseudoruegeria aquimaris]